MKNNHHIDIPLLFFSFAFFIVLFGIFSKLAFQKNGPIRPSSAPQQKNTKPLKKLDYNLPILCDYKTKESSISAAVDTNSIVVTLMSNKDTQRYVVQGDCLYSWSVNELKGKKKCGIGSSIAMGKQFLSSGLGSIDTLISAFQKSGSTSSIDFQAVLETCKNVREIKKEVFVIPKGMIFE